MGYEPRCAVCKSPVATAAIDGAIATGETPYSAWKLHGEALELGQSSVYRHVRLHSKKSRVAVEYLDGTATTGDVISDLNALRENLHSRSLAAAENGHDAAADRAAREAHRIAQSLLAAGIPDDAAANALARAEGLTKAIQKATLARPAFATELAEAARARGDTALASDADELAAGVAAYLKKEN